MVNTARVVKKNLHDLVDALPTGEMSAAKRYLEYLRDLGDPVLLSLHNAPIDDEFETAEEKAAVAEARRAIKRGDVISHEQMRRELGL